MIDSEVNKVYTSEQPESDPSDVPQGTVLFSPNKYYYKGEATQEGGDYYFVADNAVASYKMIHGSDRTLWRQLERFINTIPNGPYMMDSRDGGISIHNMDLNQAASYTYRYAGGNGELLSFGIKTSKKKKNLQATQSSTIDPKTKSVTTTVSQSLTDESSLPTTLFQDLLEPIDKTTWYLNNFGSANANLTYEEYVEKERKSRLDAIKDIKTTVKELQANYQVTEEDVKAYLEQARSTFEEKLSNAEISGDIAPLLGMNSMGRFIVKKKVPVRMVVNPVNYGGEPGPNTHHGNLGQSDASRYGARYKKGLEYIKSNPTAIYIGPTSKWQDTPQGQGKGGGWHTGFYPTVEIIVNKEIEFEIDGARIFSGVDPQSLQDAWASNELGDSITKQLDGSLKVLGNPSIVSSRVVKLLNLSDRFSGDWYIKEAKHVISPGTGYTCECSLIRKGLPISVASTKMSVDMNKLYSSFHKVAKETVDTKYANRRLNSLLKQEFRKTYTNENGQIVKKDNEVVSVDQFSPSTGTVPIRPASEDLVNIFEQRSKERDNLKK